MRIISADCHINEPPTVFDRVPAALKERAPRMMRGTDGGDGWSFDGQPPKRTFGIEATAGQQGATKKLSGLRFDEIMPGNWDGKAHVADMPAAHQVDGGLPGRVAAATEVILAVVKLRREVEPVEVRRQPRRRVELLGPVHPVGEVHVGMRGKHCAADGDRRVERELIIAKTLRRTSLQMEIICNEGLRVHVDRP